MPNVFDYLDAVRARPGVFLRDGSLRDLQSQLYGYYAGIGHHGVG